MKTDLDHLPAKKQRELGRVLEILHEEFEDALKHAASARKKRGRISRAISNTHVRIRTLGSQNVIRSRAVVSYLSIGSGACLSAHLFTGLGNVNRYPAFAIPPPTGRWGGAVPRDNNVLWSRYRLGG